MPDRSLANLIRINLLQYRSCAQIISDYQRKARPSSVEPLDLMQWSSGRGHRELRGGDDKPENGPLLR